MIYFQYKATDAVVNKGVKFQLLETDKNGKETRHDVFTFSKSGGVIMGMYNTDEVALLSFLFRIYKNDESKL